MKVYVIFRQAWYSDRTVNGVEAIYNDRDEAEAQVEKLRAGNTEPNTGYYVEHCKVILKEEIAL